MVEDARAHAPFPVVFDVWLEKLDSQLSAMRDATVLDNSAPQGDSLLPPTPRSTGSSVAGAVRGVDS